MYIAMEQRDIDLIFQSPINWEYFRDKTVLVTGATGRIGMYLVEALSKANSEWNLNITILTLARSGEKLKKVFGPSLCLPYIHQIVQDITDPLQWDGQLDYIFHTAGLASPKDFTERPVETLWGHLLGTRNVLELAREKHAKVLYVSTIEIYGDWRQEERIQETDVAPLHCDNVRACYPEAKRMCETMLVAYHAEYGVPFTGVRLSHTLGPGIDIEDGRSFAEFLRNVKYNQDIVLHSDGSAVRTYTYTADAVGAMLLAFTTGQEQWYNIANIDNLIAIGDLAELIASLSPQKTVKVIYAHEGRTALRYLNFHLGIMDVSRIQALGWKPYVNLENTFRYTFESIMQQM